MGKLLLFLQYVWYFVAFLLMVALVLLPSYLFLKELYDHVPSEWGILWLISAQAAAVMFGVPSPLYCFVLAGMKPMVEAGVVVVAGHTAASLLIFLFIRVLGIKIKIHSNDQTMDPELIKSDFMYCLAVRLFFLQAFNKDYGLASKASFPAYLSTGILWSAVVAARFLLISRELVDVERSWLLVGLYCLLWAVSEFVFQCFAYYIMNNAPKQENDRPLSPSKIRHSRSTSTRIING